MHCLGFSFLNSKEYNTEITPAMLEQASPGADAATTLFVTRLYDSEIITVRVICEHGLCSA